MHRRHSVQSVMVVHNVVTTAQAVDARVVREAVQVAREVVQADLVTMVQAVDVALVAAVLVDLKDQAVQPVVVPSQPTKPNSIQI